MILDLLEMKWTNVFSANSATVWLPATSYEKQKIHKFNEAAF